MFEEKKTQNAFNITNVSTSVYILSIVCNMTSLVAFFKFFNIFCPRKLIIWLIRIPVRVLSSCYDSTSRYVTINIYNTGKQWI